MKSIVNTMLFFVFLLYEARCAENYEYPHEFICPIAHEVMRDPVVAEDGFSYERERITEWFNHHNTSPITGMEVGPVLIQNNNLRVLREGWVDTVEEVVAHRVEIIRQEIREENIALIEEALRRRLEETPSLAQHHVNDSPEGPLEVQGQVKKTGLCYCVNRVVSGVESGLRFILPCHFK